MASHAIHLWTLRGLIGAFLDLALVYLLLCVSAYAFVVFKVLSFLGVYLPCPCTGIFGYKNSDFCLHKLLVDWPARRIYLIQKLAFSRFPFDLLLSRDQELDSDARLLIANGKSENGALELDCEPSPGSGMQMLVDKESGFDGKGKKVMNQKHKSSFRRRKRVSIGYGKPSSVELSSNRRSAGDSASCSYYHELETQRRFDAYFQTISNVGDAFFDDKIAQTSIDVEEATADNFEQSGSYEESRGLEQDSPFLGKSSSIAQETARVYGDEGNRIQMLERNLEKERSAYAALCLELEKERVAAATAADEAVAMILRLQEEKASVEMEARQYQRLIEEKFAYDEDEINILKEILVGKEKENHLLEKEIEAYRQMDVSGDELSRNDLPSVLRGGNSSFSVALEDVESSTQMLLPDSDLSSLTLEITSAEATFSLERNGDIQDNTCIVCQNPTAGVSKTDVDGVRTTCIGEGLEINGDLGDQPGSKPHSSVLEMEPAIYDVHVIDDHVKLREKGDSEEPDASSCMTLDMGRKELASSSVCEERWKLDTEVEQLRNRLQPVQSNKEKLVFSTEQREIISARMKLLEEIVNQLQELQLQASVPPSS